MPFSNTSSIGPSSSQRGIRSDSGKSNQSINNASSGSSSGNAQSAQTAIVQSKDVDGDALTAIQKLCKSVLSSHQNDEFKEYEDLESAPSLDKVAPENRWAIVRELYNLSADLKGLNESNRVFVGLICSFWVKINSISKKDYIRGLTEYLDFMEDLQIDVPKIWEWSVEAICKWHLSTNLYID